MLATLFTHQLLFDGLVVRARLRPAGDGHRARLPGHAGHQLRRRQHGPRRRRAVRPAGRRSTTCRTGWRRCRRARRRHAVRRAHRTHRHPAAVRRTAGDRARGHDRHRPTLAGDRARGLSRGRRSRGAVPDRDRRRPTRSASSAITGPQLVDPDRWCRSIAIALAWLHDPHHVRQEREGIGREPRPRPARRHQPEAGVDVRVGRRRCAVDDLASR